MAKLANIFYDGDSNANSVIRMPSHKCDTSEKII